MLLSARLRAGKPAGCQDLTLQNREQFHFLKIFLLLNTVVLEHLQVTL